MLNWWRRIAALFLACAALQLLLAGVAAAGPYTAKEMLSECQALLATAKETSDPDAIELGNTFSTGACWGAFLSIQQFATLKTEGAAGPLLNACVPEDVLPLGNPNAVGAIHTGAEGDGRQRESIVCRRRSAPTSTGGHNRLDGGSRIGQHHQGRETGIHAPVELETQRIVRCRRNQARIIGRRPNDQRQDSDGVIHREVLHVGRVERRKGPGEARAADPTGCR